MVIGSVLAERYRIDQSLDPSQTADAASPQGLLWRGSDLLASEAPVALRQLASPSAQARFRSLWPAMQAVLHPQIPRFGGLLEQGETLWLVREWQQGTPLDQIQQQPDLAGVAALAVLGGEGIDRDHLHAPGVAGFEHGLQAAGAAAVSDKGGQAVLAGPAAVAAARRPAPPAAIRWSAWCSDGAARQAARPRPRPRGRERG